MWLGRLPKVWSAPIIHIGKITSTSPKSARNQDQPPKLCPYCKTSWKISLDFPKALDFHFFVHSAFTSIEAALAAESLLSRKQASFLNGKRYFQNGQGVECTLNISQFFDKCTQYCTFNLDPLTFFKKKFASFTTQMLGLFLWPPQLISSPKITGSTQGKTESLDQDQVLLVFSSSVLFFVDFRSWSAIKVKQTLDTSLFLELCKYSLESRPLRTN